MTTNLSLLICWFLLATLMTVVGYSTSFWWLFDLLGMVARLSNSVFLYPELKRSPPTHIVCDVSPLNKPHWSVNSHINGRFSTHSRVDKSQFPEIFPWKSLRQVSYFLKMKDKLFEFIRSKNLGKSGRGCRKANKIRKLRMRSETVLYILELPINFRNSPNFSKNDPEWSFLVFPR